MDDVIRTLQRGKSLWPKQAVGIGNHSNNLSCPFPCARTYSRRVFAYAANKDFTNPRRMRDTCTHRPAYSASTCGGPLATPKPKPEHNDEKLRTHVRHFVPANS